MLQRDIAIGTTCVRLSVCRCVRQRLIMRQNQWPYDHAVFSAGYSPGTLVVYWWSGLVWSSSSSFLTVAGQSQRHPRSPSCAALTASATVNAIQCLTSSVHRLLGLPCFLVPAIRQCSRQVLRQSALTTCPKYCSFLRCMSQQLCGCIQFF